MVDLPEIFVLRHGQTEWNRAGIWQGDLDSPLTEQGQRQADDMGAMLAKLSITPATHKFYTSPMGRARETMRRVIKDRGTAIEDARLREISVGDWTGLSREEICSMTGLDKDAHFLDFYAAAPGGESFETVAARCHSFLATLTQPSVVVTHGITSRFLRTLAMGWGTDRIQELPGGQGVIHHVFNRQHAEIQA